MCSFLNLIINDNVILEKCQGVNLTFRFWLLLNTQITILLLSEMVIELTGVMKQTG